MKIFNKKNNKFFEIGVISLFFFLVLSLFLFYSSKGLINLGDINYPLELKGYLEKVSYAWQYSSGAGKDSGIGLSFFTYFAPILLFRKIGFSMEISQAISYSLLFFLPFLFFFLLLRKGLKLKFLSSLIGSFLYVLNPFHLASWYVPIPWNLTHFTLIPLILFIIYRYWNKSLKLFYSLVLSFFVFSYASANVPMLLASLLTIFSIIPFYQFRLEGKLDIKKMVKISLFVLASFILANSYWLFALFFSYGEIYKGYIGSLDVSSWILSVSKRSSLYDVFSLRFILPLIRERLSFIGYSKFLFSPVVEIFSISFFVFVFSLPFLFIKKMKKSFWYLYFLFLLTIFFVKAANPPFSQFFLFLFKKIPFFGVFKSSPEKFGIWMIALLSLLTALGIERLDFKTRRNKLVMGVLTFTLILFSFPFYSLKLVSPLEIGSIKLYPFYNEPESYKDLREYLNKDDSYSRVLYFNGTNNYMVSTNLYNGFYFRGLDPIANNTRKGFIQPYNRRDSALKYLFSDFSEKNFSKTLPLFDINYILFNLDNTGDGVMDSFDLSQNIGDFYEQFDNKRVWDKLHLFEVDEKDDLPKIYASNKNVFIKGDSSTILDIAGFSDWDAGKSFFVEQEVNPDEIFIKAEPEIKKIEELFKKRIQIEAAVNFPFVNRKPGSFFYSLLLEKEKMEELFLENNSKKLFNKKLSLANKRIAELKKFSNEVSSDQFTEVIDDYVIKMKDALNLINLETPDDEALILEATFSRHLSEISSINDGIHGSEKKYLISGRIRKLIDSFEEELFYSEKQFEMLTLEYSVDIPSAGFYEIYAQEKNEESLSWKKTGEKEFGEKNYKIGLGMSSEEIETSEDWISFKEKKDEGASIFYKEIPSWDEESLYLLSLDYKADRKIKEFGIIEKGGELMDGEEELENKIFTKAGVNFLSEDHEGINFQTIISPEKEDNVRAYFYVFSLEEPSSTIINLKILKIFQPGIILKKTADKNDQKELPIISFKRINPVKYEVEVRGASDDYNLIFLEGFNKNWKAYFKKQGLKNDSILNKFFSGIFETNSLEVISEKKHLKVNGYANLWQIDKVDFEDDDYKIIIEYWPQKLFYYGLGIFLVVLGVGTLILIFKKIFKYGNK